MLCLNRITESLASAARICVGFALLATAAMLWLVSLIVGPFALLTMPAAYLIGCAAIYAFEGR